MTRPRSLQDDLDRLVQRFSAWPAALQLLPVFALLTLQTAWLGFADLDLFARAAVGRLILRDGAIPLVDSFAFTPTKPVWYDHEWLSGVIFYAVSRGGDVALALFAVAMASATAGCLFAALRLRGGRSAGAAMWMLFCVFQAAPLWRSVIRAQAFSALFIALMLLAITRYRMRGDLRWLVALPLVMAAWVNLHGGFVLGLAVLAIIALAMDTGGRPRAPLIWCLAGCGLATLVNPYGLDFLQFIVEAVAKPRPLIVEWSPLWSHPRRFLSTIAVALMLMAGFARAKPRVPREGLVLLALTLVLGLRALRLVSFFYLVAAVYGWDVVASAARRFRQAFPAARTVAQGLGIPALALLCGAGLATAGHLVNTGMAYRLDYEPIPVRAMEWLIAHRGGGRLLTEFDEGSYALWRGHPRFRVSLDGRYEEVYPESTFDLVHEAYLAAPVIRQAAMKRLTPDYILLCRATPGHEQTFGTDWHLLYRDPQCLVLGRSPNPDGTVGAPAPGPLPNVWQSAF